MRCSRGADAQKQAAPAGTEKVEIVLLRELHDRLPPLSLLDIPPPDDGMAGAKLAIQDNNTTGRFMKQEFVSTSSKATSPTSSWPKP